MQGNNTNNNNNSSTSYLSIRTALTPDADDDNDEEHDVDDDAPIAQLAHGGDEEGQCYYGKHAHVAILSCLCNVIKQQQQKQQLQ